MDRYENKVKIEEIKSLMAQGAYEDAADVADTVDWSNVKNIPILGRVSDLYKKLHQFDVSREILLYAYEKQKTRPIIKSLCELSIALGDFLSAIEYYKEFIKVAPRDPSRYILQYKIYKAQDISIEEQIETLEKLKEFEHSAKWEYELAELYHKAGMETKCIQECDEIILWVVDGKYVIKAFELKAQHTQLTDQEIFKYELLRQAGGTLNIQYSLKEDEKKPVEKKEFAIGQDISACNTQNLQAVVAEGLQDVFDEQTERRNIAPVKPTTYEEAVAMDEAANKKEASQDSDLLVTTMMNPILPEAPVGQELERAEEPERNETPNFSDTDIIGDVASAMAAQRLMGDSVQSSTDISPVQAYGVMPVAEASEEKIVLQRTDEMKQIGNSSSAINNTGVIETFHKGTNLDDMLSQGYDGQISMVIPEEQQVEKQITGQISIDEIMQEWEQRKRESEERLVQDVKARIRKQTDTLLADFDEATKTTLLRQIEDAMISAALKEEHDRIAAGRPKQIKVADIAKQEKEDAIATANILEQILAEEKAGVDTSEYKKAVKKAEEEEQQRLEAKNEEAVTDTDEASKIVSEEIPEDSQAEDNAEEVTDTTKEEAAKEEDSEQEEVISEPEKTESKPEELKKEERKKSTRGKKDTRELTRAEIDQFGAFIKHRSTQRQLVNILDNVSLASYTGNVLVTYEEAGEVTTFSKLLIQEIQLSDGNFTGSVAVVSGETLNRKEISEVLDRVKNGALIISDIDELNPKTIENLLSELDRAEGLGVVVILQGRNESVNNLLKQYESMAQTFNLRIELKAFDNKTLVEYAKAYAYDNEYAIDELGVLALHTRLSDMQTADHEVTMSEVEEIIDEAMYYADRKNPKHFFDIIFGKRYNEEDMIILREEDFMHY